MAGSIMEKSIINDYAEGPAVTNNPSRRVKPIWICYWKMRRKTSVMERQSSNTYFDLTAYRS